MFQKMKSFFVGRPLANEEMEGQRLGILWGLPILSSDAISSVAYAGQEILMVLVPVVGILAYKQLALLSIVIIGILLIVMLSYRQTIDSYPNGGGAYIVAKENIGVMPGVIAGSALSIDYLLTVTVSIASGVENLISAFEFLAPYRIYMAIALILVLMLGNLRGVKESSKMFGIPAYAFIFALGTTIVVGLYKLATGFQPTPAVIPPTNDITTMGLIFITLKAFSNGCSALTGVEAVSNAVPNFKEPSTKYAKKVLLLLSLIIIFLFGGTSILANAYQLVPSEKGALLVLLSGQVFGNGFMYYFVAATTFIILVLAANTAYTGFPMLLSVISKDGYAPRQLGLRGDRLAYDNGIVGLSVFAIILMLIFQANVSSLIGLYAVGVFTSFTLSQIGMFLKWKREKGKNWRIKAFINGLGAIVTGAVVIIVSISKFFHGAWIVVLLIPLLSYCMLKTKKHYESVKAQLKLKPEEYNIFHTKDALYKNHVIIPIQSINRASVRALKYAYSISDSDTITVFSVVISEEEGKDLQEKYDKLNIDIPLKIVYSPYRKIVEPLLEFIQSTEHAYQKGDMVTVVLSKFQVQKLWQKMMHNNTIFFIKKQLQKHKHIVVSIIPLQLCDKVDCSKK